MKTNEQILRKLLRDLNTVEVAILRERIMAICELTLKHIHNWPPEATFPLDNASYKKIIQRIQSIIDEKKSVAGTTKPENAKP